MWGINILLRKPRTRHTRRFHDVTPFNVRLRNSPHVIMHGLFVVIISYIYIPVGFRLLIYFFFFLPDKCACNANSRGYLPLTRMCIRFWFLMKKTTCAKRVVIGWFNTLLSMDAAGRTRLLKNWIIKKKSTVKSVLVKNVNFHDISRSLRDKKKNEKIWNVIYASYVVVNKTEWGKYI